LALIEGAFIEVFNDACLLMMAHWTFGQGQEANNGLMQFQLK
jgi:hypothetical protein